MGSKIADSLNNYWKYASLPSIRKINGNIAGVETTDTASKAYDKGRLLVVNNVLYKASVAIAKNATLAEGVNITRTTVEEELSRQQGGVTSFNGRTGVVLPQNGDYTAAMVGARASTWTPSAAEVGAVPVARTVNGKPLSSDVTLSSSDVGAIPATQKGAANGVASLGSDGKIPSSQLSAVETTGNKVTSLSAGSTDAQYPSAKCVYDLIGNVEAALAALR